MYLSFNSINHSFIYLLIYLCIYLFIYPIYLSTVLTFLSQVKFEKLENELKDSRWSRLIETYTPLRAEKDRSVLSDATCNALKPSLSNSLTTA